MLNTKPTQQKISIIGTESTGKTVFLAALTRALTSQTTLPRISPKNALTVRYTAGIYDQLELGEWPKSTDVGVRQDLRWLWTTTDKNQHELKTFDCSGQDFRTIFESETDAELNPQQLALKNEFFSSHLILLLINLQSALNIYKVPGKNSERVNMEFAPAAAVRKLRQQNVSIYLLFTQYDRYQERIEKDWNGNISLALQALLPDLHSALVETGTPYDAIAAVETELRNGELLPKINCPTGDLSTITQSINDFLVKNAPILAQREQQKEEAKNPPTLPPPILPTTDSSNPTPPPPLQRSSPQGLKSNETRTKCVKITIQLLIITDVIAFILNQMQRHFLINGDLTVQAIELSNGRIKFIYEIFLFLFCISAVAFMAWFSRAYENVRSFSGKTRFAQEWTFAGWFAPLIYLWRPYQVMKDMFQRTYDFLNEKGEKQPAKMAVLRVWWLLWLTITPFCGAIIFIQDANKNKSPDALQIIAGYSTIQNFLFIPLALITLRLIKQYSELEKKVFDMTSV